MNAMKQWYGVRTLYRHDGRPAPDGSLMYEERIVLFHAEDAEEALSLAEHEASEYADDPEIHYLGFAQCYLCDGRPGASFEAFSLMRENPLPPEAYIEGYFHTGREKE